MKRIAIIIGDGASGGGALPGVMADHDAYRAFLVSDAGGAWNDNEIVSVQVATSKASLIKGLKAAAQLDFALVVFSGHGYVDAASRRTMVCVGRNEEVSDLELTTGAPRQLTIIDSCRQLYLPTVRKSLTEKLGAISDSSAAATYRRSCRARFDAAVERADGGLSLVYACSPGEAATDTPQGGLFSSVLIDVATSWAAATRSGVIATQTLGIDEAAEGVVSSFAKLRIPQTPVPYLGRRRFHFPVAVA